MGRIMSLINTTTNGFADSQYVIIDAEYYEYIHGLLAETQTIAFGRKTFDLFHNLWPPRLENKDTPEWQAKMARALNDKQKAVFSSTLKTTTWNNSTIIQKVEAHCMNVYKQGDKGGLLTIASFALLATLAEMKLIDDFYFCIQPLIAGDGNVRLFDKIKLDTCRPIEYMDSKQLKSVVHIVHYQSSN
jgi:dihydrofolate reductase